MITAQCQYMNYEPCCAAPRRPPCRCPGWSAGPGPGWRRCARRSSRSRSRPPPAPLASPCSTFTTSTRSGPSTHYNYRPYMYLLSAGPLRGRVRGHEPHAAPLAAVRREAAVRPGHAARTQAGAGRHQPVLPRHVQR